MQPIDEIPFIAGNAALDFVNTAEQRGDPEAGDVLVAPADLRLWGQRYGLLTGSARLDAQASDELERAREARELLYALFFARVHHKPPSTRQLARLAEFAAEAYGAARLRPEADGSVRWDWSEQKLATVRHVAVTSAVELLHTDVSHRLKQCPGEHCGWLFLDTTKRGNRRWCLMSECGQDAKDERRRQRRRAGSDPSSGRRPSARARR